MIPPPSLHPPSTPVLKLTFPHFPRVHWCVYRWCWLNASVCQMEGVNKLYALVPAGLTAGAALALSFMCTRQSVTLGGATILGVLAILYYGVKVDTARGPKALIR